MGAVEALLGLGAAFALGPMDWQNAGCQLMHARTYYSGRAAAGPERPAAAAASSRTLLALPA